MGIFVGEETMSLSWQGVSHVDTKVWMKWCFVVLTPVVMISHLFQARKLISDFAIILSILIFCGIDALVGVDTPKLIVPSEFKVCCCQLVCWPLEEVPFPSHLPCME